RAPNLKEAVALHGGQAQSSANRFKALSARERSQVEAFLDSLVAPPAPAAPGVLLAANLESRLERAEWSASESFVRLRREEAGAPDEQQGREEQGRKRAAEAVQRAAAEAERAAAEAEQIRKATANRLRARLQIAETLEKMGKFTGALEFYTKIVREAP